MKYDLGQKYDDMSPCCAGEEKKGKMHYPTLYFTHSEKIDLPEEGEAVIKFRKVESAENTRDPDDPKYRCELEIHSLETKGGAKKSDGMVSMGDALKQAMRKKLKQGEYAEEDED